MRPLAPPRSAAVHGIPRGVLGTGCPRPTAGSAARPALAQLAHRLRLARRAQRQIRERASRMRSRRVGKRAAAPARRRRQGWLRLKKRARRVGPRPRRDQRTTFVVQSAPRRDDVVTCVRRGGSVTSRSSQNTLGDALEHRVAHVPSRHDPPRHRDEDGEIVPRRRRHRGERGERWRTELI